MLNPAPKAGPFTMAMTGFGHCLINSTTRWRLRSDSSRTSTVCSVRPSMVFTSPPAQKARPAPVRITTPISGSDPASSNPLFHGGAPDKAVECFTTARVYAQKLNQPPTEAHILDSLAKCHALAGKPAEAEKYWTEALAAYDKISAPPLAYARDGGKKLIYMQLEQHYAKTKQADKLVAVKKELARG